MSDILTFSFNSASDSCPVKLLSFLNFSFSSNSALTKGPPPSLFSLEKGSPILLFKSSKLLASFCAGVSRTPIACPMLVRNFPPNPPKSKPNFLSIGFSSWNPIIAEPKIGTNLPKVDNTFPKPNLAPPAILDPKAFVAALAPTLPVPASIPASR